MKCENTLCIYYECGICILDEIEVNMAGMCDSCIQVSFSEVELSKKRKKALDRLARQYEEWDEKDKA